MELIRKIRLAYHEFNYRVFYMKKMRSDFDNYIKKTVSVVIKKGGVYNNKAITNEIVFEIFEEKEIKIFKTLFKIEIPNSCETCLCAGSYAIELFDSQKNRITTIGLHHNTTIRLYNILGDAILKEPNKLIKFFKNSGFNTTD